MNKNISKFIDRMISELNTSFSDTFKLINTKNKRIITYLNIELVKGNIPIVPELLNKYGSVKEIFECENVSKRFIQLNYSLDEYLNLDCKISNMKNLAIEFESNHFNNKFVLDGNYILVSKSGIRESIENIYRSRKQHDFLKEHLVILMNLEKIIEHARLVNQCGEKKKREKYNGWNYYLTNLFIGENFYLLEFEVVSMSNGENHYRVQNLYKK